MFQDATSVAACETSKLDPINFDPRRAIYKTTRAGLISTPGFPGNWQLTTGNCS
jgi:hypothetical protein